MTKKRLGIAACLLWAVYLGEAAAQVATAPLLLQDGVAANLVVTIDDSASMAEECIPASLCVDTDNSLAIGSVFRPTAPNNVDSYNTFVATYNPDFLYARQMRASRFNELYYNPMRLYLPWVKPDGTSYPNVPPSAAPYEPNRTDPGTDPAINLRTQLTRRGIFCNSLSDNKCTDPMRTNLRTSIETFDPAQYYIQAPGTNGRNLSDFSQILINSTTSFPKHSRRTDCVSLRNACSRSEELQNFANWFTYYRNKWLVAKAAVASTFDAIPANARLGYGKISLATGNGSAGSVVDGEATGTLVRGVRPFSAGDKNAFYDWFLNLPMATGGGTPLRPALADVGNYYMRNDNAGPWAEIPGGNSTQAHLICRRALHMLITDGAWNRPRAGATVKTEPGNASMATLDLTGRNVDGDQPRPFRDDNAGTLADVAMYYWKTNLRSDIARPNSISPNFQEASLGRAATWPHMVNFMIGFGVTGTLRNPDDVQALINGTKTWPNPDNDAAKIDDLWHAAWNSGGLSFSANDPGQLQGALQSMINSMRQVTSSDAPSVTSSRSVTSRFTYVPYYQTQTWTGDIKAYAFDTLTGDRKQNPDGSYAAEVWSAQTMLNASNMDPSNRPVFTLAANGNNGIYFSYSALNAQGMVSLLNAPPGQEDDLINYLRGNPSLEGTRYRSRSNAILGDVVNSGPLLVFDGEDNAYDFLPDAPVGANSSYKQFLSYKKNRGARLFVGSNDGMLHAFDASTGRETFAFVPKAVLGSIKELANPSYAHQYYVDGLLVEADIYDSNLNKWRNIVIGTGGAGARNIFAINVPVPSRGNTSTVVAPGASDILWEVSNSDAGFSDLGKVLQKPAAGLMQNGSWAVVVGNGYIDANGVAKLFVINALTGALIKSIAIPTTGVYAGVNGLGGVRLVLDMQRRVTAAYAGDLQGNMWKFDFSSNSAANWGLAFAGSPLYRALDSSNKAQPITATPAYLAHPLGGMMVLFGTGKLFAAGDQNNTDTQSLYGIWDTVALGSDTSNASGAVSSASSSGSAAGNFTSVIVQQTVSQVASTAYYQASQNVVDYASKRGWFIKLPSSPAGLRMVYPPLIAIGRVFMQTLSPQPATTDPCNPSQGQSLNFVLNPFTGTASRATPTFDINGDGKYDSADAQYQGNAVNVVAKISGDTGAATFAKKVGAPSVNIGALTYSTGQTTVANAAQSIKRSWRQIVTRP
jgi:type IV pilus assembly protein PilY1